ncbi:unnamed protein product [Ilex paraguariensis]|uniref:Chloroplast sensor kinase, chloroplastic n=1 Tax=Ilex paraguariensis TaxID=185542 RepID=A0ABC8QTG3_9AQUA
MLLSAITPQTPTPLTNPNDHYNFHLLFFHHHHHFHKPPHTTLCNVTTHTSTLNKPEPPPLTLLTTASSNYSSSLRHVSTTSDSDYFEDGGGGGEAEVSSSSASAAAVAEAIRKASSSPVEFAQRMEKDGKLSEGLILPSPDFQRLCLEQLDLFRRIVNPDALLSVYVRPAGSYVMDRLELRRITYYPGVNAADIVILIGNFSVPTGLRAAEAALSNQQAEFIPECRAVVFPLVKHPFVVGFLVAELPEMELEGEGHDVKQCPFPNAFPPCTNSKSWEIQTSTESPVEMYKFTAEQRLTAINISRSLAMAYVMDQKAMLLQQSSWQNNVRMSNLVEQIRGPLSSIRTLSKMLSMHMKKSEVSHDIVEDILVQGDRIRDTLQQLQDAVYLTKANIIQYNEETLKKMHHSNIAHPESTRSQLSDNFSGEIPLSKIEESGGLQFSLTSTSKDLEMPMPPLALAPIQQQGIRLVFAMH